MKYRRLKLLKEIMDKAEVIGANKMTLYCLIATMTDKRLTIFHKEFLAHKEPTDESTGS